MYPVKIRQISDIMFHAPLTYESLIIACDYSYFGNHSWRWTWVHTSCLTLWAEDLMSISKHQATLSQAVNIHSHIERSIYSRSWMNISHRLKVNCPRPDFIYSSSQQQKPRMIFCPSTLSKHHILFSMSWDLFPLRLAHLLRLSSSSIMAAFTFTPPSNDNSQEGETFHLLPRKSIETGSRPVISGEFLALTIICRYLVLWLHNTCFTTLPHHTSGDDLSHSRSSPMSSP